MKLHEFQARRLLAAYGIPVPRSVVASSPSQAKQAYDELRRRCGAPKSKRFTCQVKAQLHAGGRGKAGGVVAVSNAQQVSSAAARLIGKRLITRQTGPEGLPVNRVLLDEQVRATRELYLAVTIDRFLARPTVLASQQGGMDIEAVANRDPNMMIREPVDPLVGLMSYQGRRLQASLKLPEALSRSFGELVRGLYTCFIESDASLVEINPLVETKDGRLLALDAKVVLDDNALFRHPKLAALRDKSQEHPLEYRAGRIGISYVGLDGNIGCLVNGAGLAMATNDIIKLHGGSPANFLDVGGGANVDQVTKAFQILLSDSRVRAILVNIFGGIMRCDWIAQGLLNATTRLKVSMPIVVRLAGTNVEEGRRMLTGTPLPITTADDLADAAQKVVDFAQQTVTSDKRQMTRHHR